SQARSTALSSICAIEWMNAARPCTVPKPRRGSSRGCTSAGRGGRPGIRIGAGPAASPATASSPRAKDAAWRRVSAILSSTSAASRHSRAASNSVRIARRSEREPALPLGVVRAQLAQAFEVARLHAGGVLAAEAGAVELHAFELRPGHRLLQVREVLVDQPVAADHALDLLFAAAVRDELLGRGHVDAEIG